MIKIGHYVEDHLAEILALPGWRSKKIDYEPPVVDRMFLDWEHEDVNYRIYLHRIYPCDRAFFHPHPWPSWVRVLGSVGSRYEMATGFGPNGRHDPPPVTTTVFLPPGAEYEMVHVNGWHSVRIHGTSSFSLMVTGPVWERDAPRTERHEFRELDANELSSLRHAVSAYYEVPRSGVDFQTIFDEGQELRKQFDKDGASMRTLTAEDLARRSR